MQPYEFTLNLSEQAILLFTFALNLSQAQKWASVSVIDSGSHLMCDVPIKDHNLAQETATKKNIQDLQGV